MRRDISRLYVEDGLAEPLCPGGDRLRAARRRVADRGATTLWGSSVAAQEKT